ncbi:MAG: hypothetical protein R6X32_21415 [Chloroflexota bacterium]
MRIAMIGPFGFHPNKTMHSRARGLARPLVEFGHQEAIIRSLVHLLQQPDERQRLSNGARAHAAAHFGRVID